MVRGFLIVALLLGVVSVSAGEQTGTPTAQETTNNTPAPATSRSAPERAWDDLRWLMTALEAYATDNDELYAPAGRTGDCVVSDLDHQLEWYYENTYPTRRAPSVDPWGRPYHIVISNSRKLYALYSLGPDGKLEEVAEQFLERLKQDQLRAGDLKERQTSRNVIIVPGNLRFAPAEVLRPLGPSR
ncbi:MAG TPA: type II secretion system protein GspG [Thermoanaerobaculia bacterium]